MTTMTSSHLTIITGASRGLGRAMAANLLNRPEQHVLCISRRRNEELSAQADGTVLDQWTHDLADGAPVAERLEQWLAAFDAKAFKSVTIINNAGVMASPRPLAVTASSDVVQSLRVGLEAPMLLTSAFLRATQDWPAARKVLHISSGLGQIARGGQVPYCAVKAGLDHFARALALEEGVRPNGARVVSLYPGVIDTDMQEVLRQADPAQFPEMARFKRLKDEGLLDSPDDAARKVLNWLERADFGTPPVADLMKPA
jgi:benzil reductase ((S)-benzoin forming)